MSRDGRGRRDGRARRDAILDAALECFAEQGVVATGIEEIRRTAGASPSSIYHQFGGIQDVILALLVRTFERLFAHLARRVGRTRTAKGFVTALVDGHLEWVFDNRDEARFMYQALALELGSGVAEELQRAKADQLDPVVRHGSRFVEDGSLPSWPPSLLDVVLLGPAHEACRRFLAGAPLDPEWMRRHLPKLAWRSLGGT